MVGREVKGDDVNHTLLKNHFPGEEGHPRARTAYRLLSRLPASSRAPVQLPQ